MVWCLFKHREKKRSWRVSELCRGIPLKLLLKASLNIAQVFLPKYEPEHVRNVSQRSDRVISQVW
jgi:hypothetical protein